MFHCTSGGEGPSREGEAYFPAGAHRVSPKASGAQRERKGTKDEKRTRPVDEAAPAERGPFPGHGDGMGALPDGGHGGGGGHDPHPGGEPRLRLRRPAGGTGEPARGGRAGEPHRLGAAGPEPIPHPAGGHRRAGRRGGGPAGGHGGAGGGPGRPLPGARGHLRPRGHRGPHPPAGERERLRRRPGGVHREPAPAGSGRGRPGGGPPGAGDPGRGAPGAHHAHPWQRGLYPRRGGRV